MLVFRQAGALPTKGLAEVVEAVRGLDMEAVKKDWPRSRTDVGVARSLEGASGCRLRDAPARNTDILGLVDAIIAHACRMPKIAFVLFPDITATDVVAPLDALQMLCHTGDWEVVAVSPDAAPVPCLGPLSLSGDNTYAQVPNPDVVVVPGGPGSIDAMGDPWVLEYLRVAHESGALMASVCTGALVLGAAGMLRGRRATTHWAFRDVLSRFGAVATDARWVADGRVWTSAGVTAGLDMAVALAEALADVDTAELIRLNLEYGSEAVTSGQLRERYRAASRTMLRDRLPARLGAREAILSDLH